MFKWTFPSLLAGLAVSASSVALAQSGDAPVTMLEAIDVAVQTNPQVQEAQFNKEGIEFERKQAQGLYGPRLSVEASAGIRRLENNTRRNLGIANDELYPVEAGVTGEWTIFDFGRRRGELLRQAARVDGASLRVAERSEFIALQVSRQYLDVLLQQRVSAAAQDNRLFHETLLRDLTEGVTQGSISVADQQQAEERLEAAIVSEEEAVRALTDAKISLRTLTGLEIDSLTTPPNLAASIPTSVSVAIGEARTRNPLVREAQADVDAANARITAAEGDLYPTIGLEASGRVGDDIDGFSGETNDLRGAIVLRWNVFDSGISRARVQEMVRRASQARYVLHQRQREAEQDVRTAWNARDSQGRIVDALQRQSSVSDDVLGSYQSQFNIGRRSLLDILDAQNTRFNTQVRLETAKFSEMFGGYQILAATNQLLYAMQIAPGTGSETSERERFNYGPHIEAEIDRRVYPK